MQKEIKFRGKHIDTGEWYFGCLLEGEDNIFIRDKVRHEKHGYLTHPVIPETIGQFTGLKDKNGVEIYEGDILIDKNNVVKDIILVLWNDKYAGFTLHCDNWACLAFFYEYLDVNKVEVIGNIHDNPELLNNLI